MKIKFYFKSDLIFFDNLFALDSRKWIHLIRACYTGLCKIILANQAEQYLKSVSVLTGAEEMRFSRDQERLSSNSRPKQEDMLVRNKLEGLLCGRPVIWSRSPASDNYGITFWNMLRLSTLMPSRNEWRLKRFNVLFAWSAFCLCSRRQKKNPDRKKEENSDVVFVKNHLLLAPFSIGKAINFHKLPLGLGKRGPAQFPHLFSLRRRRRRWATWTA